ncbi:hypothetical protein B8W99_26525 [Peribacillus simplex]|nr:hypothetical protein B8W99_26525 [Peribacillus simplex]
MNHCFLFLRSYSFYVLFRVVAPPTPDTMTATYAIQPIIIIKESAYIVKGFIWKYEQKPLGIIKGFQADRMKRLKSTKSADLLF